jgi:transcriptional regulator with XRE-family HTH domain
MEVHLTDRNMGRKMGAARNQDALTFGKALAGYRLNKEMSQKAFSRLLGITPQSLCDIEKGRRIPTPNRAAKIAKKIKEPESFWINLALQDLLNKDKLNYTVKVVADKK